MTLFQNQMIISFQRLTKENLWEKGIASLDYFDKSLILLSATSGGIVLFLTVIKVPVGIASASFSLAFLTFTGIVIKLLKTTQNKKIKKQNKIVMLGIN